MDCMVFGVQDEATAARLTAAAEPIRCLILSVCTPPRTLSTLQPLPFANARRPLGHSSADVAALHAGVASNTAASSSGEARRLI